MSDTLDVTFTSLAQLSRAYGSPSVEMAERVLHRSAEGQIATGAALLVLGIVLTGISAYSVLQVKDEDLDPVRWSLSFLGALFGCIGVVLSLAFGVSLLADAWAWTALSDPQLALAHKVFGAMGGY